MPAYPQHFSFGIEMELYLKPKSQSIIDTLQTLGFNPKDTNQTKQERIFRQAMATELSDRGIPTGIDKNSVYDTWTIAHEAALDHIGGGYWPCELISPVFYTHDDDWVVSINYLFANLLGHCDVHLTKGCATHVHVAPAGGKYTLSQVKNIVKGTIYYEEPVMRIMHEDRKSNPWAQPNADTIPGCVTKIKNVSQGGWSPIFDEFKDHKFVATIVTAVCPDRNVSWNFQNLTDSGTMEFRRPRGVDNPDAAKHWIAFTLGFMANVIWEENWDATGHTKTHPSSDRLRAVVVRGATSINLPVHTSLLPTLMADNNKAATVFTKEERAIIRQKMAKKKNKRSLFVEKIINSRPNTPSGKK
ncbi:hypothetical protein H112_01554 [Trichophyton rubrum D6]|uniref:Amidoligase enzyme n=1 Tax=Trichophyton rubrum CBS 288.86 TaxID=1215330 RepID=A0A022WCV2_TRIRU|nr:hypothetical protein H102_01545 [Trichophyton rubrum CBS 100081]EZF55928.1 hypothetical protein H103_01558 [Trichophyton rubrum CBS 288.86]EZF66627.1 hypothetical protein H104_01534 [Trichophyton rubrum CBS 289.86]EZF87925.1 hypothetical protein H110_01553 [Trichophyton rubrum MR1448]EZG20220.1 hypothetical protein H107_01606 [Trichophyton rubrum CBS 202.88]KDB37105.1 hypothetical protein H112_01554 [Trichophyton rubrum D6]KMQ47023.1 putative amidoligase enzyme [Trichophyton rubrum]